MKYFLFIVIIISLHACSEKDSTFRLQIGEGFTNSNTKVYFIDTLTVKASTFQFDSLIVSGAKRLLIGAYNDPIFGKTASKSYIQLSGKSFSITKDGVYDSIVLTLKYNSYFYNDTIPLQQFKVFQVQEKIKPDENYYYNTTNFDYSNTPIATKTFLPKPIKNDSLEIKIDDSFGLALFNKIKDNDINNNSEFLDDYKGLLIASNENISKSILGFSKKSLLRIYYTNTEELEHKKKTLDFSINASNTFNNIISNQTNTSFETATDQETFLPSTETNNTSFIQAGTGLVTRVDMPTIKTLNDISGEGVIINAKLKFTLKRNTSSNNLHTRDSLKVYIIDQKNNVLSDLTIDGSTPILSTVENESSEFEKKTYVINVKPFVTIKQNETYEKFYLAIYPQGFNNAVDRYIFNGENASSDLRMKLELTYTVYDE